MSQVAGSSSQHQSALLQRLWIYQGERFPVFVHLPLITAFSFSAIGYSRLGRGVDDFISWKHFAACVLTNAVVFFILRVSDEHKDANEDAAFRNYLPVPRGLVTLRELRWLALALFAIVSVLNLLFFSDLLLIYGALSIYLVLMRYEFFAAAWLKKRQLWYVLSHMLIIPLADVYASSYDWKLHHVSPPTGLLFFFGVSYLNGIVLEIGRKIRVPETEEEGVVSYTKLLGIKGAPALWITVLLCNFTLAVLAASYAGFPFYTYYIFIVLVIVTSVPAVLFFLNPNPKIAKSIELVSLVWALGMYLTLGGIPTIFKLLT